MYRKNERCEKLRELAVWNREGGFEREKRPPENLVEPDRLRINTRLESLYSREQGETLSRSTHVGKTTVGIGFVEVTVKVT